MSWSYPPYIPVAQRRAQAAREVEKLKKAGRVIFPVALEGRKIANSFWGAAWCDNLERYSDFENRLPRGRAYIRNGSIIDLQISQGSVQALVSGSKLYKVKIDIALVAQKRWKAICRDCSGSISSLVELLKGQLSKNVMERVCKPTDGLFPASSDIKMSCTCPDWADMCKHVAAALYGVGARLDTAPELLFALRGVDAAELIASANFDRATPQADVINARILADEDVAALFGVEMAAPVSPVREIKSAPKIRKKKMAASQPKPKGNTQARGATMEKQTPPMANKEVRKATTKDKGSQSQKIISIKPTKNKMIGAQKVKETQPSVSITTTISIQAETANLTKHRRTRAAKWISAKRR